ncbi:NAD(P)-binding protein [Aspergillus steynii IBT 23096]|uniref:NAD(P)-binding protein n=1 Tax=Aspergillus steynii IBT 23096 TaxID=1392250 RepID=A0A2I2FU97_9EURO|nr:NAD(P)-binding protein [Aspergillus steynii IBT 23096]PLB44220.1 NAD(P)-binding protein [Aspergillus steynii IBT 23096]
MVRVVVAGGTGGMSNKSPKEIITAIIESGKHTLTVWTRSANSSKHNLPGVTYEQVNYDDKDDMVKKLQGVHSVLCFISQPTVQIALVDACIAAGVKRYAPNEWAARSNSGSFAYHEKDQVHEYLQEVNRKEKVLEYSLFQPGLFTNYLSAPIQSASYCPIWTNQWDIANRRAIVPAERDWQLSTTTIQDLGKVVAEALAYTGEWPEIGGITGTKTSSSEIIKTAEKIRVLTPELPLGPFKIDEVSTENLRAGKLGASWNPLLPEFETTDPNYDRVKYSEYVVAQIILGGLDGAWSTSDEWNKLLPHLKLTTVEEFLLRYWGDKK